MSCLLFWPDSPCTECRHSLSGSSQWFLCRLWHLPSASLKGAELPSYTNTLPEARLSSASLPSPSFLCGYLHVSSCVVASLCIKHHSSCVVTYFSMYWASCLLCGDFSVHISKHLWGEEEHTDSSHIMPLWDSSCQIVLKDPAGAQLFLASSHSGAPLPPTTVIFGHKIFKVDWVG